MKKISIVIAMMAFFGVTLEVQAAQLRNIGSQYTADVPALGQVYFYSSVIANDPEYKYALNNIEGYSGSATVHATYEGLYNGKSYKLAGKELSASTVGAVLWRPSSLSTSPSGYTIKASANCEGVATTTKMCVLRGIQYRLKLKNKNLISEFAINASLDFRNS